MSSTNLEERERFAREKYDSAKIVKVDTPDQVQVALAFLEDSLRAKPTHSNALQLKSSLLAKLGNYNGAIQAISLAIQIESTSTDIKHLSALCEARGLLYFKLRLYSMALKDLKRAFELDADNATLLYEIGQVYFCAENYYVAPYYFSAALEDRYVGRLGQLHKFRAHLFLGCCKIYVGNYAGATDIVTKALEISETAQAHNILGAAEYFLGNTKRAADAYQRSIDLDALNPSYILSRAVCAFQLGDFEEASNLFSNSIMLSATKDPTLLCYRAATQLLLDMLPQALLDLESAIVLQPNLEYCFVKGLVYFAQKKYDQAKETVINILSACVKQGRSERTSATPNICYKCFIFLGILSQLVGELYDALEFYGQGLVGEYTSPYVYTLMGILYFDLKNYLASIKYFNIVLSLKPSDKLDITCKAIAQVLSGNPLGALHGIRVAMETYRYETDVLCHIRSSALKSLKSFDEALVWANKAISMNSNQFQFLFNRAEIHFELSEYDKSIKDCQAALAVNSAVGEAYYLEGRCHQALDNYDAALTSLKRAQECIPKLSDSEYFCYSVGIALSCKRQWKDALDAFNRAIKLSTTVHANYFHERANVYQMMGNCPLAIADLTTVLSLDSDNFNALFSRAFLFRDSGKYDQSSADLKRLQDLDDSKNLKEFINEHFFFSEPLLLSLPGTANFC